MALPLADGVFEVHWQQREYGRYTWQLYGREDNGQLRLIDSEEFGPFDGVVELERWVGTRIWRDLALPFG